MKFIFGKYPNHISCYTIAEKILFWKNKWGTDEESDQIYNLGRYLSYGSTEDIPESQRKYTLLDRFCTWYNKQQKQKIVVKVDNWDVWGMDHTLAHIIHPLLIKLKEVQHGSGIVDFEDVPEHLQPSPEEIKRIKENFYNDDELLHERWKWVLDEMIWTFEQIKNDDDSEFFDQSECDPDEDVFASVSKVKYDREGHMKKEARINNGLRLFGKYFRNLWD